MKKLFPLFIILLFVSCTTVKYVHHRPINYIPDGVQELNVESPIEKLKEVFVKANFNYTEQVNGFISDEKLLDEYTRASYQVFKKDNHLTIHCYWGITDEMVGQIAIISESQATAYSAKGMKRVVYKSSEARPKFVMDYMANLLEDNSIKFSWK